MGDSEAMVIDGSFCTAHAKKQTISYFATLIDGVSFVTETKERHLVYARAHRGYACGYTNNSDDMWSVC